MGRRPPGEALARSAVQLVGKASYLRYPNNRVSAFVNEEAKQTDVLYTPHGLVEKVTDPAGDAGRHTTAYTYCDYYFVAIPAPA